MSSNHDQTLAGQVRKHGIQALRGSEGGNWRFGRLLDASVGSPWSSQSSAEAGGVDMMRWRRGREGPKMMEGRRRVGGRGRVRVRAVRAKATFTEWG